VLVLDDPYPRQVPCFLMMSMCSSFISVLRVSDQFFGWPSALNESEPRLPIGWGNYESNRVWYCKLSSGRTQSIHSVLSNNCMTVRTGTLSKRITGGQYSWKSPGMEAGIKKVPEQTGIASTADCKLKLALPSVCHLVICSHGLAFTLERRQFRQSFVPETSF
jgi:hypothetical protein